MSFHMGQMVRLQVCLYALHSLTKIRCIEFTGCRRHQGTCLNMESFICRMSCTHRG